jgi:hypothetical protein
MLSLNLYSSSSSQLYHGSSAIQSQSHHHSSRGSPSPQIDLSLGLGLPTVPNHTSCKAREQPSTLPLPIQCHNTKLQNHHQSSSMASKSSSRDPRLSQLHLHHGDSQTITASPHRRRYSEIPCSLLCCITAPNHRRRRLIEPMLDASSAQFTDPTAAQAAPFRQQTSLLPQSLKPCTISAVLSEPRHLHPSSAGVDFSRTSSLQAAAG